jgi:single-strand DNA-binding protein
VPTKIDEEHQTKKLGEVARVGNLTRDFEERTSPSGTVYATTGLAVERPRVPGDWAGERQTTFYDLVVFRSLAENAAKCLAKGDRVVVVGDAEVETWTGDDGQEHTARKILVNGIGPDLRWAVAQVTKVRSAPKQDDTPIPGSSEPF